MAGLKRRLACSRIVTRGQEDDSFVDAGMAHNGVAEEKIGLQSDDALAVIGYGGTTMMRWPRQNGGTAMMRQPR